jgi:N-acetylglucosamine transport system permease protein
VRADAVTLRRTGRNPVLWAAYSGLVAWAIASVVPIWAVLSSSFKTTPSITADPLGIPTHLRLQNYVESWKGSAQDISSFGSVRTQPLYEFALHSVVAVAIGVSLAMIAGTLAGYTLARNAERLRFVNRYFVVLLAVPSIAIWVPLFDLMASLGLVGQPAGLGLVYAATITPLVAVLLRAYFSTFPADLIEAAKVDGASETFALMRIVLPMSRSVVTVVALIQAIWLWNELALAEILLVSPDRGTLPMGLIAFRSAFTSNLGAEFASLTLAVVPIVLLYLVVQGRITQGVRLGALR